MSRASVTKFLRENRALTSAFLVAAIAAATLAYLLIGGTPEPGAPGAAPSAYAGSAACKECHEEVFNGWRTTFHAAKFTEATLDTVTGDFARQNELEAGGASSRATREGEAYFITTAGADGQMARHRIRYVLGSIWKQRYVTEFPNGALHVLPMQWNVKTLDWADYRGLASAKPGSGDFWSDSERTFQYECMGCHTTNAKLNHDQAGDAYKTGWGEPGVGCEACHGPGGAHIAAAIPDKAATILNPAKLADPSRAGMICGSCHTRGRSPDGQFAYPEGYQPGDQLNFMFDTKPGVYPDGSPKSHHQQYDDWQASGHQAAGVMCWDCHSPHIRGKSNRFQLKLPGSLLCRSCHEVRPQGVHGLHSVNNCVGCHMPNTVRSATPGDLRSHRFIVARPEMTLKVKDAEAQPNSCNLCHYHRGEEPERLVHYLNAARKPDRCKACHYHAEQDPEEEQEARE